MNNKINIKRANGTTTEADLICYFRDNNNNDYVYYTLNEVTEGSNSTVKIYVSKVKQNNPAADMPIEPAEWDELKGYMASVLKNESIDITYLPATGEIETVSDMAIAMPTSYDYVNKHRALYEAAVGSANVAPTQSAPSAPATPEAAPAAGSVTPVAPAAPEVTPVTPVTPTPVAPEPAPLQTPSPSEPTPAPEQSPVVPLAPTASAMENTVAPEPSTDNIFNSSATPVASVEPAPVEQSEPTETEDDPNKVEKLDIDILLEQLDEVAEATQTLKEKLKTVGYKYNDLVDFIKTHEKNNASAAPLQEPSTQTPTVETPQSVQTPTPLETTTPTPAPAQNAAATSASAETNWFDMPQNQG